MSAASFSEAILQNSDDGTEVNKSIWYESGFITSINALGKGIDGKEYCAGFRFELNQLKPGDTITFARLKFASCGSIITSSVNLKIEGVLQVSPTTFSETERPSQKLPRTSADVEWQITEKWFSSKQVTGRNSVPVHYYSPDISAILNEILALPGWGTGEEGKTLILTITDNGSPENETNLLGFQDHWDGTTFTSPVSLEIYKSVSDTFIGKSLLSKVSDTSVTITLHSLIDTDVHVIYGTAPGFYTDTSLVSLGHPAGRTLEIVLDDLLPNTEYYYRVQFRKAGRGGISGGLQEVSFRTKRSRNSRFVFDIQADEHLSNMYHLPPDSARMRLYKQTLTNIANDDPDFLISLGDFGIDGDGFSNTFDPGEYFEQVYDFARQRYLRQREYIDPISRSIPFYLVIGNHEGEQGWFYNNDSTSNAVMLTKARQDLFPNPIPDEFYSGNMDDIPGLGLRQDYYAWEWGDALFVVIAPFWYTTTKPHGWNGPGSMNGWDWTLGIDQYNWLYETLHNSPARWKFVFTHHITSTTLPACYGRGGIEVAKYRVDGRPSFEWGGEDENGVYVFEQRRPGWEHGAIHDMLVDERVTIVFHGHDHLFATQVLDNIIYQECPVPGDTEYSYGFMDPGAYSHGRLMPNSGHIRVSVDPLGVWVAYVRSYLPGDGENGKVAFSYSIPYYQDYID